jgi:hypothetical protein
MQNISSSTTSFIWLWFSLQWNAISCLPCQEPIEWFEQNVAYASVGHNRKAAGILLYCWWNVWKERNKHIFDSMHNTNDIDLFFQAASSPGRRVQLALLPFRFFA